MKFQVEFEQFLSLKWFDGIAVMEAATLAIRTSAMDPRSADSDRPLFLMSALNISFEKIYRQTWSISHAYGWIV